MVADFSGGMWPGACEHAYSERPLLAVCGHFCRIWEFFLSRTLSAFRIHCRLTLVLFG